MASAQLTTPGSRLLAGRQAARPSPRCAPRAAVESRNKRREPEMRPLSPSDDAEAVASRHGKEEPGRRQPLYATSATESTSSTATQPPGPRVLVPMQYRGTPPQLPADNGASRRGAGSSFSSSSSSSSSTKVSLTVSSAGVSSSSTAGKGAVVYSQRLPASTLVQSAAARAALAPPMPGGTSGGSTFQRSMMVAGFEEGAAEGGDLPTDYQYTWAQESYSKRQRTLDTWSFVLTLRSRLWLLDQPWSYPGGLTPEKKAERGRALAVWIRERILQLGPTFIKLGQLFSTRSDLFPAEFTEELSKLQDRVPAFSADKAEAIIERELGAPPSSLFRSFDRRPIAAASLGQVHRAVLHTGEQVVVKVQRPGLRQLFDIDLENLRQVAELLDRGDEATRDFKGIYQECASILYQEVDYINEGRNADRFRRNFKPQAWVRVPTVYWQLCSPSVLTLEYAPGIKITNVAAIAAAGLDAKAVAQRATESYLIQILQHGFFHADPHPGNIAIDTDGSLIFYDFGMMGVIAPTSRESLLELFYAVNRKDTDTVVRQLVDLGIIVPTSDLVSIRRSIAYFISSVTRQAQQKEAVASIGEDLFAIAVDQPFRFPAAFTFVLRAFATLEGIGKALDPDFKFVTVAAPYAAELLSLQDRRSQSAFLLEQLGQQASDLGAAAAAMPQRVQRIESTLQQLESGDLKLRVRVLEAERAARRGGVMQAATVNSIGAMGLLNVGVQLALADQAAAAGAAFVLSAVCAGLVAAGFRRVKRLDKFEKSIKTGAAYNPKG